MIQPLLTLRDRDCDHDQCERADRKVHVERPAPARLVDEDPAERRAEDRAHDEDRSEEPLVAPAVARRDDDSDRRVREGEQATRSEPLDDAERYELVHRLRKPAEHRAQEEDRDREHPQQASAVDVTELAVQGHGDGHREDVRRDHPGVARQAAEVVDDRRQRGRDDRLVERSQQERDHDRAVDREHAPDREAVSGRRASEPSAEATHSSQPSGGRSSARTAQGRTTPSWASWRSRRPGAAPSGGGRPTRSAQKPASIAGKPGGHSGTSSSGGGPPSTCSDGAQVARSSSGLPDAGPVPVDEDGAIALQRDVVAAHVEVKERLPFDRCRAGRLEQGRQRLGQPLARAQLERQERARVLLDERPALAELLAIDVRRRHSVRRPGRSDLLQRSEDGGDRAVRPGRGPVRLAQILE